MPWASQWDGTPMEDPAGKNRRTFTGTGGSAIGIPVGDSLLLRIKALLTHFSRAFYFISSSNCYMSKSDAAREGHSLVYYTSLDS